QELTPAQAGAIFLHTYGELDPNALFQKDRVNRIIKQMQTTGKAELEEQRQIKEYLKKIEDTEKKYKLAYRKAYGPRGAVKGLQRNRNSREAAIYAQRALAEVERYSQELEYLIFDAPLAALSQKVKKKEKENEKNNLHDEWRKAIRVQEELYPGRPGAGIPGGFETAGAISF